MATVTHKNQPGVKKTRVPLEGTKHAYRVLKLLWPEEVEQVIESHVIGTSLHICSGLSQLGDTRLDINPDVKPDIVADACAVPLPDASYDTVICDPPYSGRFQWNHDVLSEMARIARQRIIFQHWFLPANPFGQYKKANRFHLRHLFVWQPKTYFGRVQVVSIFDNTDLYVPDVHDVTPGDES